MKKLIALAILLIIPVAVCSQSIGGYYGPAESPYLVYDTFDGADSTALSAHTPDITPGGGWTDAGGVWSISGNKIVHSASDCSATRCSAYIDSGVYNLRSEVQVTLLAGSLGAEPHLFFRVNDNSNRWLAQIDTQSGVFVIKSQEAATVTLRASIAASGLTGTHTISVTTNGTSTTALLDGASQITSTYDFNGTRTVVGVGGYSDNSFYKIGSFDNLSVRSY
jgi:hypothetical protein